MPTIEEIKHMSKLEADEEAEDTIRELQMIKSRLKKNNCDVDKVQRKLSGCINSMKFILHELEKG